MCILFIALNRHPQYPLVIVANRDEFHQRPTKSMHWWPDLNILAGKDLQAQGTWLGISQQGKFSALTNYRQFPLPEGEYKSRGELPLKALFESSVSLEAFLKESSDQYQGFNLLYGDKSRLKCFDSVKREVVTLNDGFHSLCNGSLDDTWPKMAKGQTALAHYISTTTQLSHDDLLKVLQDSEPAPEALLPDTGIGLTWEKKLSAIMIKGEDYGTRSSCIFTISKHNEVKVTELTYSTKARPIKSVNFDWVTNNSSLHHIIPPSYNNK